VLNDADLAGIDTHGIVNFPTHLHYVKGLQCGAVAAVPTITVLRESPVSAAWDSGRGFGPVVAYRAMEAAIAKADATGIGMITVRNGCHFGANGYFAEMAAGGDRVAMVAANTIAGTFPPGGLEPAVGTNPFAFAAPTGGAHPLVVDIALTTVSGSKVMGARRRGEPVPLGWIVDADGNPTTDPAASSSILPLGGSEAGHKGYGLGLMVDVLGILSGTGSGLWQRYTPEWRQGQWFAAWRIDAFIDPDEFRAEMRRVVDHIHSIRPKGDATVLVPGDRRAACRVARASSGIPVDDDIAQLCRDLASATGVPFPDPVADG
jgi:L-2-hydroxycarboxylate dehydrogenase (NAD+)